MIEVAPLVLRLRSPLRTASAEYSLRKGCLVTFASGGLLGRGEAMPLEEMGTEALTVTQAALAEAATAARTWPSPQSTQEVRELIDSVDALRAAPAARHAIECALLEAAARARGLAVATLLSSTARSVVQVNALLGSLEPTALAAEGCGAVALGFSVVKVKVGSAPFNTDLARLAALRSAVGQSIKIRIDANGSWGAAAARRLEALAPLHLELVEQPVEAADAGGLRELRKRDVCPIAADEAVTSLASGLTLLGPDAPAVDLIALRPMVLGGLLDALALSEAAAAHGVGSYVVSSLEGLWGRAAATHLAAALPSGAIASGLGVASAFEDDLCSDALPVRAGSISIPTAAGWGFA